MGRYRIEDEEDESGDWVSPEDEEDEELSFVWTPEHDLTCAIGYDDKDRFLDAVSRVLPDSEIFPPDTLSLIARGRSLKCARAVLEGETKFKKAIDFTAPLQDSKNLPPLHTAAKCFQCDMIDLFLSYGAPIDFRCVTNDHMFNKMLPLNVTLQEIRTHPYLLGWNPKQYSVFDLILRLCLPHMRSGMETLRLLVHRTPEALAEEEIYHYARAGRVIELAALLMVAHEKVLSPSFFEKICGSSTTLRQFITSEITLLTALKMRSENTGNYQLARECRGKHKALMSLLLLLEVFKRAGEKLAAYLNLEIIMGTEEQVAEEVEWLLKVSGFSLNHRDLDLNHVDVAMAAGYCPEMDNFGRIYGKDVAWYYVDSIPRGAHLKDTDPLECNKEDLTMPQCLELGSCKSRGLLENAKLQKRSMKVSFAPQSEVVTYSKKLKTWMTDVPYEQWRFASTTYLDGSQSFYERLSNRLQFLRDISNDEESTNLVSATLHGAIETLSHHQYLHDWSAKKSVTKLLYILCLPELRKEIYHIRLLGCNTEQIEALGCHYAKEGKIIQLAILLMVAQEVLFPLIAYKTLDSVRPDRRMVIRRIVMREIQKSIDYETCLATRSRSSKLVRKCKDKKEEMLSMLLLVEMFELAGGTIKRYLQSQYYWETAIRSRPEARIAKNIAYVLKASGFAIKRKDTFLNDLNCFSRTFGDDQSENLHRRLMRQLDSQLHKFSVKRTIPPTASSSSTFPAHGPPVRSFHTFQTSKCCLGFLLSSSFGNQVNSALQKSKPSGPKFSSGKPWATFPLAVKRGMKCI